MGRHCEICGNAHDNKTFVAREMMFGTRDEFTYIECAVCGCLQNTTVPEDLGKYYGSSYYSVRGNTSEYRPVRDALKRLRTKAYLSGGGLVGRTLLRGFGKPGLHSWVKRAGVRQDSRILEVGCGSGDLLLSMRSEGFSNLSGADPYIDKDIDHGHGLKIAKKNVTEIEGRYDFIVLEHVFEHIPDPHRTLKALATLLKSGGMLIISIPLAGRAWKHYGANWVQLDAPRHLFLHTETSFRIVAKGIDIVDVDFNSGAFQFWGSEQYAKDIPLLDERSYRVNPANAQFSESDLAEYARKAADLNSLRLGDQATFYLRA